MEKEIKKQIIKEVRKYGIQDLTEIKLMDTIQTGNIQMKLNGAPPLESDRDNVVWFIALVIATWNSFGGNFEEEWVKAVDKVVPHEELL